MTANLPAIMVPLDELERMAAAVAKSGMFGLRTPEAALTLMLVAQAEGRHPAAAAQDYNIIDSKPAKKAEAMMRDFLRGGGRCEWHELTDTTVAATFSHPQGGTVRIDWDMNRAKKAGLAGKSSWVKYPRQMLRCRVVSEGVRTIYPSATDGLYTPEEVADFDRPNKPLRDVTPPAPSRKPADDLEDFAGDNGKPAAEPPAPTVDQETGEILDDGEGRFRIPMPEAADKDEVAAWCSDYRDALMGAGDEDDLLAIREANKAVMLKLASAGNGGRKAADRLQGIFTSQQIELRRRAAAA